MGHFSIFWQFFNITLVILEITMACDISFYAIFSNNYDGSKDISFQDPSGPKGAFEDKSKTNLGDL